MVRYERVKAENKAKVEAFLSQFGNDALTSRVENYLLQKTGGIYATYDDSAIVATAAVVFPKPHEAVLIDLMVSNSVSSELVEPFVTFQIEEATRLGAQKVRVLLEHDTEPMAGLGDKIGFHSLGHWVLGKIEGVATEAASTFPPATAGPAWAVDRDRILQFWSEHESDLWAMSNLMAPHQLTTDDLWTQLERGSIGLAPQNGEDKVDTLAIFRVADHALYLHYFRSDGKFLKDFTEYLSVECRAWGVTEIRFGLSPEAVAQLKGAMSGKLEETSRWTVWEVVPSLNPVK